MAAPLLKITKYIQNVQQLGFHDSSIVSVFSIFIVFYSDNLCMKHKSTAASFLHQLTCLRADYIHIYCAVPQEKNLFS